MEEIALGRHDEVARAAVAGCVEAAHDRDRRAVELAHDELRGAGDLVGDRDHRRPELVADRIALALQVAQHLDACGADCDVGRSLAPRAAEGVADDDADLAAGQLVQPRAQAGRGGVRIDGQEDERAGLGRVRRVDSARRADEAVARLGDHERAARANDALRLAENDLDPPRIAVARELTRSGRRLDLVQAHDAALDLRDRLLRDDEHVAVLELGALDDHARQVVAFAELRQPADGRDRQLGHSPTIWRPAWPR